MVRQSSGTHLCLAQGHGGEARDRLRWLGRVFIGNQNHWTDQPSPRLGRETVPPGDDQAAESAARLRGTALTEKVVHWPGALGENGQRAAQTGDGRLNIHGAADATFSCSAHDALILEKCPGNDVDIAASSICGIRDDSTILKRHNSRIEKNVATGCLSPALNGRIDFAVDETDRIDGLHSDIPAARLGCVRSDGTIVVAEKLRPGVDRDVSGVRRTGAAGRDGAVIVECHGLAGRDGDVAPRGARSCSLR